jgi:C-terminal processing protease CtpA/Prc
VLLAGVGTSIEGPELLKNMELKAKSLKFGYSPDGFGPSDHASFYSEKVPVFFLSTGAHDEYHTPFDDADKINFTGEKDIADYSYELVKTLANLDKNLTYQESDMTDQRQRGRRGFNVTLGIMPDYAATGTEGLRIDGIRKGGSADLGGMKKGDIITAIDGKSIKNIYDYMHRLNTLEKGKTASVDVLREGQHVILLISL